MREQTQAFDPRQHMRRPDFEIFHYQDPSPGMVELHHHDFYEVYFFLSGKVQYRVEGRTYRLEPGDLLLINPMELHQPLAEPGGGAYERMVLWIDKNYLESLSTGDTSLTRCFDSSLPSHRNHLRPTQAQRSGLLLLLEELVQERYGGEYGGELCAAGMLLQFLVALNRTALHAAGQQPPREDVPALVSQVLAYIGEHYSEPLSLDSLARHFYVSKYHLSHAFSQTVGVGVHRYIMLKRLLMAKQMLSAGVAPGVVYSHCGFGDYANFYRAFKARYGLAPRACAVREGR